ncbi:MAG: hypothetical protein GY694_15530 [Gammaproteobacteria bacterium]|nr:hypothetical protein [Gammaproteobacteria bacterium]
MLEKLFGACKQYDNSAEGVEEWAKDWAEKQKDKICGGEACKSIYRRCIITLHSITLSTGNDMACIAVQSKCNEIKEKCKDKLSCSPGGSDSGHA